MTTSSAAPATTTTVVVKRIPIGYPDSALRELLAGLGAESVRPLHHARMAGFAFAQFKDVATAQAAIAALNNTEIMGRRLVAELAKEFGGSARETRSQPTPRAQVGLEMLTPQAADAGSREPVPIAPQLGYVRQNSRFSFVGFIGRWCIHYPMPPHLEYAYPPPNEMILQNIMRSIAAVPKLYTQVLHLMNKMNLPAPFARPLPVPPMLKRTHEQAVGASSSGAAVAAAAAAAAAAAHEELPSTARHAANERERQLAGVESESEPESESELSEEAAGEQAGPAPGPARAPVPAVAAPADVAGGPAAPSAAPSAAAVSATASTAPAAKRRMTFRVSERRVMSLADLVARRVPDAELANIAAFRGYDPGRPNNTLFVRNLNKRVTEADLRAVFGRYFATAAEEAEGLQIRVLQGRMAGQAFVTFPDVALARQALEETHGVMVLDKPMAVFFRKQTGGDDAE